MQTAEISISDFVQQRTLLLNALSEALSAASTSVIGFDLGRLESRIAQQQKLCAEIAELDQHVDAVQRRMAQASRSPSGVSMAFSDTVSRLREAQARVKSLNDQHQMLLQRSRRTVNALMRSYQTFAADLYENPAKRQRAAGEIP